MTYFSDQMMHTSRVYEYSKGLQARQRAFEAASQSLQSEAARIRNEAVDRGMTDLGHWLYVAEDVDPVWTAFEYGEFELLSLDDALQDVRRSHVVMLYHHWERSVSKWLNTYANHDGLYDYCVQQGYCPPKDDLDAVRYLVNYIKHGPNSRKKWLSELHNRYPNFLSATIGRCLKIADGTIDMFTGLTRDPYKVLSFVRHPNLILSHNDIDEINAIIAACGPLDR